MLVSPIPDHAFFEQTQFKGLFGYDLLQITSLTAQDLDLARISLTCRITGQALLPSLKELLRPALPYYARVDTRHRWRLETTRRNGSARKRVKRIVGERYCAISSRSNPDLTLSSVRIAAAAVSMKGTTARVKDHCQPMVSMP